MEYIRTYTTIPVPDVGFYDSNPYNRLGGEYIIMSKVGFFSYSLPRSRDSCTRAFLCLPYTNPCHIKVSMALLDNLASIIIPLFAHRFSCIGSLYNGITVGRSSHSVSARPSSIPTPTPSYLSLNFSSPLTPTQNTISTKDVGLLSLTHRLTGELHVGPIVSWPFFGSNRGDLVHPTEIDLGPWPTTCTYLQACVDREIRGVIRENEGKAARHRLHLDPDLTTSPLTSRSR